MGGPGQGTGSPFPGPALPGGGHGGDPATGSQALPFPEGCPTGRASPSCPPSLQSEATLTIWMPSLVSWLPTGPPLDIAGGWAPSGLGGSVSHPRSGVQGWSPSQPAAADPGSTLFLLRKRYTACGVTRMSSSSSTFLILRKLSPALRSSTILLLAWSSSRPIAPGTPPAASTYIPKVQPLRGGQQPPRQH